MIRFQRPELEPRCLAKRVSNRKIYCSEYNEVKTQILFNLYQISFGALTAWPIICSIAGLSLNDLDARNTVANIQLTTGAFHLRKVTL